MRVGPNLLAALSAAAFFAPAQAAVRARDTIVLQRVQVDGTDRELAIGIAEFPPDSSKPRQKATGPEVCYVLAGEVTVEIAGEAARHYRAGETFRLPANVVHRTSAGAGGATVIASWVHAPGRRFNIAVPQ